MIFMIAFAVIGFIWAAWSQADYGLAESIPFGLVGAILGVIAGAALSLFVGLAVYSDTHIVKHGPVPLESLVDGSNTRGSFFLGSGTINDVSVFTWYEQSSDNSYSQRQADAAVSAVHFIDDDRKPYYTFREERYDDGPVLDTWGFRADAGGSLEEDKYDFYVPRGTIKNQYELDAK